jgi:DNA polymerase III delta prime subunit
MDAEVSYYEGGIANKLPTQTVTVGWALEQIKQGAWFDKGVRDVRRESDKKKLADAKKKLSYFTFSGVFTERVATALVKHSGLLCLDFDDVPELKLTKLQLATDPHCLALFVSPTQRGLKMLVQIDPALHLQSFLILEWYFRTYYALDLDKSGKDVPRACFVSADSELVLNTGARVLCLDELLSPEGDVIVPPTLTGKGVQTGGMPRTINPMGDGSAFGGDVLTDLQIVAQRVLDAEVDLTNGYNNWLLLAFSCASVGEAGRDIFHALSSRHAEYSQVDADKKFDDALKNGKFTKPAWVFTQAKRAGVDIKTFGVGGERTGTAPVRKSERREETHGHKDLQLGQLAQWDWAWPKGCKGNEELQIHAMTYGFIEHGNRVFFAKFNQAGGSEGQGSVGFTSITNFVSKPLFLILSKNEPKRIIELRNIHNKAALIDLPAQALKTSGEFEAFILGRGNYHMDVTRGQFSKMKQKLLAETKEAEEVPTLGYHGQSNAYAFSNGMVTADGFVKADEFGMVELPETGKQAASKYWYLPALSKIYANEVGEFEQEKKIKYIQRGIAFEDWATHFVRVNKANGFIELAYYVAALFRDVIYAQEQFFPHLFLFGPPGTGKSNAAWALTSMFGKELKPFNLNSGTQVGFHRSFALMCNGITWFDEYSNSIDAKRVQDLKGAYDGAGHTKGEYKAGQSSGNRVTNTPVLSGCVISGQELPTADNALFKRVILMQHHQTEFSDDERRDNDELKRLGAAGLSEITGEISKLRKYVVDGFAKAYDKARKELKDALEATGCEERIISNRAQLLAVMGLLQDTLRWPYTYDELKANMIANGKQQEKMVSAAKETSQFWDIFSSLVASKRLADKDDFVVSVKARITIATSEGTTRKIEFVEPTRLLFVRLVRTFSEYRKEMALQRNGGAMDMGTLRHYLHHSKEFVGQVSSYRFAEGSSPTSAMVFDYEKLVATGVQIEGLGDEEGLPFETAPF